MIMSLLTYNVSSGKIKKDKNNAEQMLHVKCRKMGVEFSDEGISFRDVIFHPLLI